MRIGIDSRSLQDDDRFRGIGAYLSSLLQAMSRIDRQNEYLLYAWTNRHQLEDLGVSAHSNFRLIPLRRRPTHVTAGRLRNCLLRDVHVSPRDVDVFLQPNALYGLPRGAVPTVAVAYDLIPLIFRYWALPGFRRARETGLRSLIRQLLQGWIYRWSVTQLASATHVIAISYATQRDLVHYVPHLRGRVTVTHLSCDPHFRRSHDVAAVLAKFGIARPFLLYVGGADVRKNVVALLESYDRLRAEGHELELVLVGKEFESAAHGTPDLVALRRRIATSRFTHGIKRVGFVERDDLVGLYSAASAFVFPSLYEGFGLPILEAMACGCPVIAYRTSSIPEVAGTAAVLLDPSEDLTDAVAYLLRDEHARNARIAAGYAQAAKFSWERTAANTLEVLHTVAKAAHGI